MPTPSSGRESRRGSKSSATPSDAQKSSDRREKAKSSQVYDGRRRPSRQAESSLSGAPARPPLKGRTNSAPLIDRGGAEVGARHGNDYGVQSGHSSNASTNPRAASRHVDAQDEDEVAGVVGAVRTYQPFKSFEVWYWNASQCREQSTDLLHNYSPQQLFQISMLWSSERRQ